MASSQKTSLHEEPCKSKCILYYVCCNTYDQWGYTVRIDNTVLERLCVLSITRVYDRPWIDTSLPIRSNGMTITETFWLSMLYTLKTPKSNLTRKGSIWAKLHSGSRMTRKSVSFSQTWQIMGSDWPSCQVDRFSGHRWPGMEFGPNGPFPGQVCPGCF